MSLRAKLLLRLAPAAFIFTLAPLANAAEIPITGIEAFHQGDSLDGDGSVLDAINGTGMDKPDLDDPSTWTVSSNAWQDDWQGFSVPAPGSNDTWAVIDLGAPAANLETIYLWNVQEGATGPNTGQWQRGTLEFEVFHATAPTVAPPATSGTVTPYDFESGGWTSLGASELLPGIGIGDAGQAYDLSGGAGARYIGLKLISNHGGNRVGFGEAAFSDVVDANALTLGEPIEPPDPVDPVGIPITALFGFHQGDSLDGDGSILKVADTTINKNADPEDPATWTHANSWQSDWQGFEAPGVTPNGTWAVLDLGEVVTNFGTLFLWNVNETGGLGRGMNEFRLHAATAPTVAPPEVSGTATAYDFASGGWTSFGETQTLTQGSGVGGEPVNGIYDITGMPAARYIGIEILSNHGAGDRVGFGHVVILPSSGPGQRFEIVSIDTSEYAADRIGITWRSRPGQTYAVSVSNDLKTWTERSDNEVGEADQETTSYVDEDSGEGGKPAISEQTRRYYRVSETPNQ